MMENASDRHMIRTCGGESDEPKAPSAPSPCGLKVRLRLSARVIRPSPAWTSTAAVRRVNAQPVIPRKTAAHGAPFPSHRWNEPKRTIGEMHRDIETEHQSRDQPQLKQNALDPAAIQTADGGIFDNKSLGMQFMPWHMSPAIRRCSPTDHPR